LKQATFSFSPELDDILPRANRGQSIIIIFRGRQSVKHLVEALGVPHTQIGHMFANRKIIDFNYLVQGGDKIEVFPATGADPGLWGIGGGEVENDTRFLLDNHLGKLATYLRIMGFDVMYRNDFQDDELLELIEQESRILLTRDRGLLKHKIVRRGYWIRSLNPKEQVQEVVKRFNLGSQLNPFRRCPRCNSLLEPVNKTDILHRLLPLTQLYYDEFVFCPACDHIYWKGSHYEHILDFLQELRNTSSLKQPQVEESR
jgi:uncharacterized protein with PIN domain